MTIQRIFRCHRQNFLDMRRVSLYGRTSQNTCKCASSACFPYIICFVRSSQNPEEVRTCQQHCLWFIQICFGQSWAPVLQQQLFCMFKWAFLYVLCTFHVLWGSKNLEALKTHCLNFLQLFHIFWGPFCVFCSVRSNQLQKMWKNQNNPENIEAPWDNVSDTRRVALSGKTRSYIHSAAGKFSNQAVSM